MDSWQQVLDIVEKKINQQSYNTWFKPTQLIKRDDTALYVRVPNAFFQDWLNDHIDVVLEAAPHRQRQYPQRSSHKRLRIPSATRIRPVFVGVGAQVHLRASHQ